MSFFIDVSYDTLVKYGEELSGDMVNVIRTKDCTIVVMADGLGSGVKANILATLTSKIAGTMLREGADIYETVDTIANTLPVCKTRGIAYSTFTLIKIYKNGDTYIAEYDNPPIFLMRDGESLNVEKKDVIVNGRRIKESKLRLKDGDTIIIASDGVIHAGLGDILNLGWQWQDIEKYLKKRHDQSRNSKSLVNDLLGVCYDLYCGKPGDDTTVVSIKARYPSYVNLFTGPPKDKNKDSSIIKEFISSKGKKIICGGTAANIAERELNRRLKVNVDYINEDIPPTAEMEGIYLVTEGVLTLSKAIEKIKLYLDSSSDSNIMNFNGRDGVSKLAKVLVEECTHLNIWVGKSVNTAYKSMNFSVDLSTKVKLVEELCAIMKDLGKNINVNYI